MASLMEIMQLCRLCLVKDQVNIPIFEEQGDIRQIFLKISACLPVKVSREDNLPKKICDGCSYKLEILYQFWNTSVNSEKQLLKWLSQIGVEKNSTEKVAVAPAQPHSSLNSDGVVLKQEVVDLADTHSVEELAPDDLNDSNDAQDYILQQQQLPYQPIGFQFQQDGFTDGEATASASTASATITSETVEAKPKRKRRAAAMKALPPHIDSEEEDEDDVDMVETKIAKTEEQSDDSGAEDPEPTTFVGLPSTSTDNEQPGPSGVGKGSTEAPSNIRLPLGIKIKRVATENADLNKDPLENLCQFTPDDKTNVKKCSVTNSETDKIIRKLLKPGVRVVKIDQPTKKDKFSENVIEIDFEDERVEINESDEDYVPEKRSPQKKFPPRHKSGNRQPVFMTVKNTSYVCVMCGQSFSSFDILSEHMKSLSCSQDKSVVCPICDKSFKNKYRCNAHLNTHKEKPKYPCKKCTKEFSNTIALHAHMETMHTRYFDAVLDGFACKLCDKQTPTKQMIMYHINTSHLHVSTFLCDVCGKSFCQESNLRVHSLTHSDSKPFMCQICSKSFKLQSSLRAHINTHNQDRRFICEECGKTFKKNGTLIEHKKHHSGEFPFRCDICNKKFVSKSAQNTHMKSHTYAMPSYN